MIDLISRQAAIAAFKPYALYDSNRTNAEWVRRIELVLEQLPSAEKHGKWGLSRSEYGNIELIKCSECNFEYPMLLAHMFRYCPGCGAKMERSEDGET